MTVPTTRRTTVNSQEAKFFKAIGARIAEARKAQGLTQTQLAEHLGLAQQTYAHYENGRLRFPASILPTLIQVLGVASDELLGLDETPRVRSKRGPMSKFETQIEQMRQLPKAKQQLLIAMLDAAILQASHGSHA